MVAEAKEIVGLVPAAGRSRRMGRNKLFLPWAGTSVVGAVVDALLGGGADRVLIVRRPDDRRLREWIETRERVRGAVNPRPEEGMLSTILAGMEALGGAERLAGGAVLLICPADHPAIQTGTVERLVAAALRPAHGLVVPVLDGRRGHPLALSGAVIAEVPELDPAVGLRQLLERRSRQVLELPVTDRGVVTDLDTPASYLEARS